MSPFLYWVEVVLLLRLPPGKSSEVALLRITAGYTSLGRGSVDLVFSDFKNTVCLAETFVRNNRTIYTRINETGTNVMKPIMKCVRERSGYRICLFGGVSEFVSGGCSFGDCPGDSWQIVAPTYLVLDRCGPSRPNNPPVIEGVAEMAKRVAKMAKGVCGMSRYGDRVTGLRRTTCKNVVSDNDGGGSSHALIASVHLTLVMLYFYSTISLL